MDRSENRNVTYAEAAAFLRKEDDFLILAHASPDGDTIGSSYALCLGLRALGKRARVSCSDPIPPRYGHLALPDVPVFEPRVIVTSDIADTQLFGKANAIYADKVALCIDHHPSNTQYAERVLLLPTASSTCEIMADLLKKLEVKITKNIADCIYTGLSTDTGCFRYSNTGAKALRLAAEMLECGAHTAAINKRLFETVSRQRLAVEQMALQTMEFHLDGRAALIVISLDMREKTGAAESDMEGFASLPVQVEGVQVGITIHEKGDRLYKLSVRTNEGVDASAICAHFGGGGHKAAAGCKIEGTLADVKTAILNVVEKALDQHGWHSDTE
ncbi:DHH family phosphoesterase [Ethanoligenens harbinense]|uniref:Phosphoesterase RecJ domain protein n=1 Tax=Ethanoligenens harbinense (strain DSM 18485 / JCM 12961 / CGMCC 1.5033 / YUAN-3) TaxID=663278 RepID=E6U8F4_ETHHY|nr:DHH family phosphoesterase [Ethanoligenens harbinense]ADU28273.1 phosphoesterase RecJ domain protein [Ethanoligenens harbinense YUAN-3]